MRFTIYARKKYKESWLTTYDLRFLVWCDKDTGIPTCQSIDLTEFNPTVSQYFIDPSTRVCFNGEFCYDCLIPNFPGYAPSGVADTDARVMKMSRGELRLIEYDATDYGFSYVTNRKLR